MKNITKLALISSLTSIMFVGCGESGPTSSSTTDESTISSALKTTKSDILEAINNARAEARDCNDGRGLVGPSVALTWNSELYTAAYEHSNDLATSDTFSHDGSGTASDVTGSNNGNTSQFNDRIRANGYTDYTLIGENIAGGLESIESAVTAWLASPAHCTNIMESEFTEIGVAVVANPDSTYGIYWTQNFGGK
jgi:uncharacterized protein YkwD